MTALPVNRLTVLRAHRLTARRAMRLLELRALTGIHLLHLTVALPPQYAARLFDAREAGAPDQQLQQIAAEALKEVYLRGVSRRRLACSRYRRRAVGLAAASVILPWA